MKDIATRLQEGGEIDSGSGDLDTKSSSYKTPISSSEYREESIKIIVYLTTLKKLAGISVSNFRKFKQEALKHRVHGQKL